MPIEMRMESGGLHAHFDRRQVIRSRAPSGPHKPPTRKRSKKSALMASVWGKLWTPYCNAHRVAAGTRPASSHCGSKTCVSSVPAPDSGIATSAMS